MTAPRPRFFVAGGAGFIGSHLLDRLAERGSITVFDNLSVGRRAFISRHLDSGAATLIEGELLDLDAVTEAVREHDVVFQLAANPEARWGLENTRLDLEQGTITTWNVLEAMRRTGVSRLVFSSSGTVYGDTDAVCAEGDLGRLPISLYGASKLAGESLVSAFVECFALRAHVFRFGNVVGPRGTHGAALDFLHKLKHSPDELEVLGDGSQAKPYVFVTDVVDAMLFALDHASDPLNVYNIAPSDTTSVQRIAELCIAASPHREAKIRYTGGSRGWPGDVPKSRMDASRLARLGWSPKHSSDEAVRRAIAALALEVFEGGAAPPTRRSRGG